MVRKIQGWRLWLLGGTVLFIALLWADEYFDLPHTLLGGPATPLNLPEVLLEGAATVAAAVISWRQFTYCEQRCKDALREQQRLATIDDLTGAFNRRECMARATWEFQRAQRFRHPLSLAMLDLDDFKSINDIFGHLAGDRALIEFTRIARGHIRAQDCFGRLGGDEFLVLFIETGQPEAVKVIERIGEQWGQSETGRLMRQLHAVTLSAGIATSQCSDESIADCIHRADQALYLAKSNGRNRVELA